MTRTQKTIDLNNKLKIVNIDGLKFKDNFGVFTISGWAFEIEDLGFVSYDGFTPYALTNKKTLQEILNQGGFLHYDTVIFVQPLNE